MRTPLLRSPRLAAACLTLTSLSFCLPPPAHAQDWAKQRLDASPRHHEWVKVQAGARTVETYVAYPEVSTKAPVVLLIHEIFGLTDWAREMADELAGAGYIVVAPDLLSGMGPGGGGTSSFAATAAPPAPAPGGMNHGGGFSMDGANKAVSELSPTQVQGDLKAAADYGVKLPAANGKLAVVGFCWGGGKSFSFATARADLGAAFVFYGPAPDAPALATIHAPVYGFYAGNDARITASLPQTQAAMKAAGKPFDPVTYPGAGHGFMRAGEAPDASPENKAAREQAFTRLTTELAKLK